MREYPEYSQALQPRCMRGLVSHRRLCCAVMCVRVSLRLTAPHCSFCLPVQHPSYYKNVEWPIISAAGIGGRCQYFINNLTKGTHTNHSQPLRWRPSALRFARSPSCDGPTWAAPLGAHSEWRAAGAEELCVADGLITMVRCAAASTCTLAHSHYTLHCAELCGVPPPCD